MIAPTLAEALSSGYGVERAFLCPVHADTRPSASVNTLKMLWVCYTCGAKGKVEGAALLGTPDFRSLRRYIDSELAEEVVYPEAWLNQFDSGPVHPAWLERFSEQTCRQYRLGFDIESGRLTYPLRGHAGEVLGVVKRTVGDPVDGEPKYKYPYGVDIGQHLFGYTPAARRTVVLVEGMADAAALNDVGIEAWAIYGARMSSEQMLLVQRVQPSLVVTAFDADEAGFQAFLNVRRQIRDCEVKRVKWPRGMAKDIAELPKEYRRNVVNTVVYGTYSEVESSSCRSSQQKFPPLSGLSCLPSKL